MKIPLFDPITYLDSLTQATHYVKQFFPSTFIPHVALTLGSGGLEKITESITPVTPIITYDTIPNFPQTSVEGHGGKVVAGYIEKIPTLIFQGRTHYYEIGDCPNIVSSLKYITFPVYLARALGASIYMATNAAGGLTSTYQVGDIMAITSHMDLFFPNPLYGPQVAFMNAPRFQSQHTQYNKQFITFLTQTAQEKKFEKNVHKGVYAAVTGPTYESQADVNALRTLGVDAVGMSTIPEIIIASNIGMETIGISLITNVIAQDGTNATSHQEVTATLENPLIMKRVRLLVEGLFTKLPFTSSV